MNLGRPKRTCDFISVVSRFSEPRRERLVRRYPLFSVTSCNAILSASNRSLRIGRIGRRHSRRTTEPEPTTKRPQLPSPRTRRRPAARVRARVPVDAASATWPQQREARRSPLTDAHRAGNVTLRPLPLRRSPHGESDQLQPSSTPSLKCSLHPRVAGRVGFVVRNDLDDRWNLLKSSPPRRAVDACLILLNGSCSDLVGWRRLEAVARASAATC